MPATRCDDSQPFAFTVNGECDFNIAWTWDGVSVPPNCQGTIQSIAWANRSATTTYYAHVHGTRVGTICKVIAPGASGSEARKGTLKQAGLETLADIHGDLLVDTNSPGPDERVI